jgi:HK97 family phage prohead protease
MPYFITDKSTDCSGWATIKDDGEVLGCHESKADAIAQMVALSLAEGIDPGGERALPENYRPALALDVPEGRACGNCMFYDETNTDGDRAWCGRWDEYVRGDYYCNAWQSNERTTMSDLEIRTIDTEPFELRVAESGGGMTFSGYAAKYDSPSLPLPFTERIAPGAFTRTLKSRNDIRMYVNHDDRMVLASSRAKTLRLEDRADGLFVEADLPPTTYGNDLRVLIERGDVSTMSFGFSTVRDSWSDDGAERTLEQVRLHEVSVVTGVAAYPATTASVRNLTLIAKRTATDFDALTDAICALELGELSDDQASLLRTVVDRAAGKLEEIPVDPTVPMSILVNKLDLIAKQLNI